MINCNPVLRGYYVFKAIFLGLKTLECGTLNSSIGILQSFCLLLPFLKLFLTVHYSLSACLQQHPTHLPPRPMSGSQLHETYTLRKQKVRVNRFWMKVKQAPEHQMHGSLQQHFFLLFGYWGLNPRLGMLGKSSITELHPQAEPCHF